MFGWAAHTAAALALIGLLFPQSLGILSASQNSESAREAAGILSILDALGPGIRVSFHLSALDSPEIRFSGHQIIFGTSATDSFYCPWNLPSWGLTAGPTYTAWLSGASVEMTEVVRS